MTLLSRGLPVAAGLLLLVACDGPVDPPRAGPATPPVFSTADGGPDAALTDYAESGAPTAAESEAESEAATSSAEPLAIAGLAFFTSRAAFRAEAPDLPLEDFEEGNVSPFGVVGCPGPVDANNNNNCFSPGEIQAGVQFNSSPPRGGSAIALLGPGFAGAPSRNIVANFFVDAFVIDFTVPNVTAAGMDLVSYFSAGVCQIEISGAGGPLGATTSPCTNAGTFWGVVADEPITRIRISSATNQAEGTDNVEFGEAFISVVIDIKPGSDENPINLNSKGVTPLAVLTTSVAAGDARDFDATQIDVSTVAFGPGGASEAHGNGHVEDVDGDGDLDLVLHFDTHESGISCADSEATLVGRLADGRRFKGTDSVQPKDCVS